MKYLVASLAVLLLVGCNTMPTEATDSGSVIKTMKKTDGSTEVIENLSDYALYARKQSESKPLFEMTCPTTGCVVMSLKVNAPDNGKTMAAPPESASVAVTKGFFGLAQSLIDRTAGVMPWYYGAGVLKNAFDKANSSVTTIDRSDHSTSDSSNRSTTNTTTTTNTTNTTTTTTNSNNRTCSGGNAGTGGGTTTGGAGGASGPTTC